MNKAKHYIFLFWMLCITTVGLHAQEDDTSIETDSISEYVEIDYNLQNKLSIEEQKNTQNAYTLSNDSTLELKKFPPNFKAKYQSDSALNYELTDENNTWEVIKRWFRDLLNRIFSGSKVKHSTEKNINNLFEISGYILIIAVLYYIVRAYLQKELYWFVKRKGKNINIAVDEIERNLETVDFSTLIRQTEQDNSYRLAIRYYYLWLLQKLQEQNHIKWHLEKTNSDYLREIKNHTIKQNFAYLSYIYNNIWYGEQQIDLQQYENAKKSFTTTLKPTKNE